MTKHTIGDVIRMAGHLLEHNPTTGEYSNIINGKECFCLAGAIKSSSKVLGLDYLTSRREAQSFLRAKTLINTWEGPNTNWKTRLNIAKKLQAYKD